MAYMCDDSDNLMAIAQQVIQQKQQRLHQQQQQQQNEDIISNGDVDHLTGITTRWGSQQVPSMSERFPFSHPEPVFSDPFLTEDDPMEVLGMPLAGNLDHAAFRLPNFGSTAAPNVAPEDFDSEGWMDSLIDETSTEDGSDFLARDSWHRTSAGGQLLSLPTPSARTRGRWAFRR
ncbi:hypothetical protein HPP92_007609 [Vanilla planifolia]|uniref:Uncharacterized protein n=1 Tax=Vanilla planifolia TaxID=51239 RepID=A0A835REG7_VANPL|nr:hypothetical protein HPP92_007609 [Vanilla planifolia]